MKKLLNAIIEKDEKGNLQLSKSGITLIALVITIVVLIILAALVIGLTLGDNGILNRAKQAKEDYLVKANEEQVELAKAGNIESTRDNTSIGPAGSVIAFMGDNEPEGYLKCEGQAVSRTTYSALFTAIGTKYGAGDGSTTFNVPDLRGEFLRGAGTNSHTTQGNGGGIGEHQDATRQLYLGSYDNATTLAWARSMNRSGTDSLPWMGDNWDKTYSVSPEAYRSAVSGTDITSRTMASLASARPTNTSVLYCIKY